MIKPDIFKVALIALGINFAFGVYNAVLGLIDRSFWFLALAAYFIVLGVMRFAVVLAKKKNGNGVSDVFITRFTGALLLFMGITLAGITYISASEEKGDRHGQIVMITIAVYAFAKITIAVINFVRARKDNSATIRVLRNIALADAAVSIFSLQRSMLVSFKGMTSDDIFLMNCLTGTAVYILMFILGVNLMAKSKLVKANQKIADAVVGGYKKVEDTVVGGYKKVENAVVKGYTKIEDKFVDQYLTREGETVEEAKERLKKENK